MPAPQLPVWRGPDGGMWIRLGFEQNHAKGEGKGQGQQNAETEGDPTSQQGEEVEGGDDVGQMEGLPIWIGPGGGVWIRIGFAVTRARGKGNGKGLQSAEAEGEPTSIQGEEAQVLEDLGQMQRSPCSNAGQEAEPDPQTRPAQAEDAEPQPSERFTAPVTGPTTSPQCPRQPFSPVLKSPAKDVPDE